MNAQKKLTHGLWGILAICILAGICFIRPVKVEAAPFKAGGSYMGERTKVGKYYLWDTSDNTLRVSTSKTGKGKVIARASKGRTIGGYVSDGATVYYPEIDTKTSTGYIYSIKINGKKRTLIGKVKKIFGGILACNSGNLYIGCNDHSDGSYDTYRLNTKTKKGKTVLKNAAPIVPGTQYKHYIIFVGAPHGNSGWSYDAYIFNCKTEKAVKISSKALGGTPDFSSGKVYFAEYIDGKSVRIKCCSPAGKSKKTLVKKLSADLIGEINAKYVYYMKGNKYYRYSIKTKKSKKISKSKYQW